jgi:membrane protein
MQLRWNVKPRPSRARLAWDRLRPTPKPQPVKRRLWPIRRRSRRYTVRRVLGRALSETWSDRVLGLSAEAAFWSVLSLVPLLLTFVGLLSRLTPLIGEGTLNHIDRELTAAAGHFVTPAVLSGGLEPLLKQVRHDGQGGFITFGFIIALWSGSTATNAYVNAITIAYGMRDVRSAVRSRLIAFGFYCCAMVTGIVVFPLLVLGPDWARDMVGGPADSLVRAILHSGYWPGLFVICTFLVMATYHVAVPAKTSWRRDLPGALVAVVGWLGGSALLRVYLAFTFTNNPVYGSLAAPIAGLLFLYVTALSVFVGAELNSAVDSLAPTPETASARRRSADILGSRLNPPPAEP